MAVVLTKKGAIREALELTTFFGVDLGCCLMDAETREAAEKFLSLIGDKTHVSKVREACAKVKETR